MYPYTHIEPEIRTVGDLISRRDVKLFTGIATSKQFLDFKHPKLGTLDEDNVPILPLTNWDRLQLTLAAKKDGEYRKNIDYYNNGNYGMIEIPVNTTFFIPDENILRNSSIISQDLNIVKATTLKAFISDELNNLFQNKDYRQIVEEGNNGTFITSNRGVKAYMWIRAAGDSLSGGEWVNISAFIHNQQTFVGENGGNFSIEIAPVVAGFDNGQWALDNGSIQGLSAGNFNDAYAATAFINKKEGGLLKRGKFFFHTTIQANDLVYIKFEDLQSDATSSSNSSDFRLSPEEVARTDWDMIGLVDTVPQVVNSVDNNILIRITGRDLIKGLIDDECVFFPEEYATSVFGNMGELNKGKLVKRLYGKLIDFNTYVQTSIEFNLKFILNQLSETGFVSNNAFKGYNLKSLSQIHRNKFNTISLKAFGSPGFIKIPTVELSDSDGIWKIVKLIVDKSVRDRRVVDNSIFASQGSLLNFVRKVCQAPLVEFMSDTYGKQFYLTARKPPFDREGLISLVYDVSVEKPEGYGKVNVTHYAPDISGLKNEAGEYIAKGADLENVDIVAERGIFDKTAPLSNLTISIDESVVFNENLVYDTRVYSWYSYNPKGMLNGIQNDMAWSVLKAVKFEEYVEVWGSKPLQLTSNYTRYHDFSDANQPKTILKYETQALHDLKYIVESNAYLPFTRTGTLTIHGDRRFKRGMYVHYLPTDEVFYVDSVQQRRDITNSSVERTTVLNVSRGMVEPYIKGRNGISYFDIMNLDAPDIVGLGQANKILSTWKVNKDVFDFFIHRWQWVDNSISANIGADVKNFFKNRFGSR